MTPDAWFAVITWGILLFVWIPYNYLRYRRNIRIAKAKRRAYTFASKYRTVKELKDVH